MKTIQFLRKHHILHSIITVCALAMAWRGVWGLCDIYLFPQNQTVSYLVTFIVGLFLLYIDDRKMEEVRPVK